MRKELFSEISECLGGTCSYSSDPLDALEDALFNLLAKEIAPSKYNADALVEGITIIATELQKSETFEAELSTYLDSIEQYHCAECGWWSHSGEIHDNEGRCDSCVEDAE